MTAADLDSQLAPALAQRQSKHLYRTRRLLESPQGPVIKVAGKDTINFCSNDYLGLANHPDVKKAMQDGIERFGVGSGASHLVNGHGQPHQQLEEALADLTGRPRALLFSTGYMANIGAVTAVLGRGDAVFEDRLNHASLLDAGLLSGARFQRFHHLDYNDLRRRLEGSQAQRKLVVSDGVFSMDGDIAPLKELAALCRQQNAWLMVDDAHGFGCLGDDGGGVNQLYGMTTDDLPILMGTLGKAFGVFGAFVAGSETLIETLIQCARPYIYTTALPPSVASAALTAVNLARKETWRRQQLQQLIEQFREGADQLGLTLLPSTTPIQPLIVGDAKRSLALSKALERRGILVTAIRPPTVAAGSSRLRITLSAGHSTEQVGQLLSALEQAQHETGALN